MTAKNKEALELATRVVDYIEKDALTDADKKAIHDESIANFNENYNPGWLEICSTPSSLTVVLKR